MHIGFDAKRAYHNRTGLGYYSRTLINLLLKYYPQNEYSLFNPKPSTLFSFPAVAKEVRPTSVVDKLFSSAWRSSWVKKDLLSCGVQLYHGLSHEIPVGIDRTSVRSVVTIHDLIHERYPGQYNPIDVRIYHRKFLYACRHADRIVAISQQTKKDVVQFYKVPEEKVEVCYQSCDPAFSIMASEEEKEQSRAKYGLPERFFLYVGSVIERKNLLSICKALKILKPAMNIPLVVIGEGGRYKRQVKEYIASNGLEKQVIFLLDKEEVRSDAEFRTAKAFATIYQSALAMVYPSMFEGFGAPVLEALWSRLPVITSRLSCLPEVGGDAALYIDPMNANELAASMMRILEEPALVSSMKEKGVIHASKSAPELYVRHMMEIYQRTMGSSE
jgi:glycosyltransferase involved in cell wall biosynthesis